MQHYINVKLAKRMQTFTLLLDKLMSLKITVLFFNTNSILKENRKEGNCNMQHSNFQLSLRSTYDLTSMLEMTELYNGFVKFTVRNPSSHQ